MEDDFHYQASLLLQGKTRIYLCFTPILSKTKLDIAFQRREEIQFKQLQLALAEGQNKLYQFLMNYCLKSPFLFAVNVTYISINFAFLFSCLWLIGLCSPLRLRIGSRWRATKGVSLFIFLNKSFQYNVYRHTSLFVHDIYHEAPPQISGFRIQTLQLSIMIK